MLFFSIGHVLCDPTNKVKVTNRFRAQIITFDLKVPIVQGTEAVLHIQNINVPATISKLFSLLDRNLEVIKRHPRCLTKNQTALVEVKTAQPICVELYSEFKGLGRFMLRQHGQTIAAGIIVKINKKDKQNVEQDQQ